MSAMGAHEGRTLARITKAGNRLQFGDVPVETSTVLLDCGYGAFAEQ